ncbi:TRADD-N-associated membrane domain-containing protein [Streptomyces sioyaensis]|uniref:TRADD-N-associated membrane domain-containing protein n=1 Tax=Streptomyces sioyaensis TaxID=67364 RepID=UPI003D71188A
MSNDFKYSYLDPSSARQYTIGSARPEDASSPEYPLRWRASQWEQWLSSEDRKKVTALRSRLLYAAGAVVLIAVCGAVAAAVFGSGWRITLVILITGALISCALTLGAEHIYKTQETSFVPSGMGDGEDDGPESPRLFEDPGLQNLIVLNRAQMQVYHEIATKQARLASRNSRWAMVVGYIVLIAGAIVAIRTGDQTSKIVTGALALMGGLLSGYISRTFLRSERAAMAQLSFYFRQPLVTSYVLSAERLTLKSGGDRKDQLVTDVVQGVLAAAQNSYAPEPNRGASRWAFTRSRGDSVQPEEAADESSTGESPHGTWGRWRGAA